MIEKYYYENIIDEMLEIIKTNILIHYNNDESFLKLKEYCLDKENEKYQKLDYWKLIFFVEEALAELISCDYLYDFRTLE